MEGIYTVKGEVNEGYDGPSTSSSPPPASGGRPTTGDVQVAFNTHAVKTLNDLNHDDDLKKDEGKSRVCFVCRIVCVLASITLAVFLIVWFSAVEG